MRSEKQSVIRYRRQVTRTAIGVVVLGCANMIGNKPALLTGSSKTSVRGVLSCSRSKLSQLGYTIDNVDNANGLLKASKKTSGLADATVGRAFFSNISISATEGSSPSSTDIQVTAFFAKQSAGKTLETVGSNRALDGEAQQVLSACGTPPTQADAAPAREPEPKRSASRPAASPGQAAAAPASPADEEKAEVIVETALLRAKASTEATILRRLTQGTELTVLDRANGWAKVKVGTTTGYVRETLLSKPR
jgi:hypothetical protein